MTTAKKLLPPQSVNYRKRPSHRALRWEGHLRFEKYSKQYP
jgi:hypothetical protein